MPLGTDHYTAADLAAFIPEKWSKKVNDFYRSVLAAAGFFTNLSEDVEAGGDIVHVPGITEFSSNDKVNGSEVTLQSPTEASVDLTVKTWKEASFLVEDNEADQVAKSYNTQKRLISSAAYAPAKSLDTALLALYSGLSNNCGDSASDVTDANILCCIQSLDDNEVPAEDRAFFFKPSVYWGDIMGIQKYYDASQAGWSKNAPVVSGLLGAGVAGSKIRGVLYGIPVIVTTQVPVTSTTFVHNLLAHKDAFAYAVRSLNGNLAGGSKDKNLVRFQGNYIAQYLGALFTADLIYGVVENRDANACEIRSRS